LNTIRVKEAKNPKGKNPKYPFMQPFFLRINLAVGSNGGNPGATQFPAKMEIDYIRVYQ
jgi:beta-glucanase (GH16 family)